MAASGREGGTCLDRSRCRSPQELKDQLLKADAR